jgi:hypothetical protein
MGEVKTEPKQGAEKSYRSSVDTAVHETKLSQTEVKMKLMVGSI